MLVSSREPLPRLPLARSAAHDPSEGACMRSTRKAAAGVPVVIVSLAASGCATGGGFNVGGSRDACIAVAGLLGGIGGSVIANQSDPRETDERLAKGALGVAAGAALGYVICGEAGRVALPDVAISATPRSGEVPLEVDMEASVSSSTRERDYRYEWDLGDGTTATGPSVSHVYEDAGTYTVRVKLVGPSGESSDAATRILARPQEQALPPVSEPPSAEPAEPERIVLRDVTFGFDSAAPMESDILDSVEEKLRERQDFSVRVIGHTDSVGSEAYNLELSGKRARSVVDYLVDRGIDRRRFEVVARGESQPIADNRTESGRAQNRRVELELLVE
jgi:outer membrane protein OmpA-like peptidoglycan-associated protein